VPSYTLNQVGALKHIFPFRPKAVGTEMDRQEKISSGFEEQSLPIAIAESNDVWDQVSTILNDWRTRASAEHYQPLSIA